MIVAARTTHRQPHESARDRIDIVVRFLAILELYKQGLVDIEQFSSFGDIVVVWTGGDHDADLASIDGYEG